MRDRPSLRYKVIINILILVVIIAAIGALINVWMFCNSIQKSANDKIELIATHVIKTLEIQDKAHLSFERSLQYSMEQPMRQFQAEYERSNRDIAQIDLDTLRERTGGVYDYFIIDANNTIIRTTFAPDDGLELGRYPAVNHFLNWVREHPDEVHSERAMTGINGYMKKYIYETTPDKKYILEIGASFSNRLFVSREDANYFDFPDYISSIMEKYPILTSINIYDRGGSPYYLSNAAGSRPMEGERLATFTRMTNGGHSAAVTVNDTLYSYVAFRPYEAHPQGFAEKIIEVAIDVRPFREEWLKSVYFSVLISLGSLILALFAGTVFTNSLASTIGEVVQAVRQIAAGDLSTPVVPTGDLEETQALSQSIETMRKKLQAQFHELELRNEELAQSYQLTIQAFFRILEHRERYTAEHSFQVNQIAMGIGKEMGLSSAELQYLAWGTLLHDIGKLVIDDDTLLKPGKLTEQEYEAIKQHPLIGCDVLPKLPFFQHVAQIVHYHHERYDGGGYPCGLCGEQIPLLARICAVADAVHAMTSDRPYRQGCSWSQAVEEIKRCSGSQFDPNVVAAFLRIYGDGSAAEI
jgi:putative nucleotidyltransferase with HDIG domain